jgi:Protein of unknown function (DUF3631)
MLCDEVDNADLANNRTFRTIVNGGHRRGGSIGRTIDGHPRSFSTFSPMVLAAINAMSLPLPLRRRAISIHLERADGLSELDRFDEISEKPVLDAVHRRIVLWVAGVTFAADPAMPKELGARAADNWRPLLSIADAYSEEWGKKARSAARTMARGYSDEDITVTLLRHIRDVFDARSVGRIHSDVLVEALLDLEDSPWAEWRGVKDNEQPRKLTPTTLAAVLRAFQIRSRSIWLGGRTAGSTSRKGYYRRDFEPVWRKYCPKDGTRAQPHVLKAIAG